MAQSNTKRPAVTGTSTAAMQSAHSRRNPHAVTQPPTQKKTKQQISDAEKATRERMRASANAKQADLYAEVNRIKAQTEAELASLQKKHPERQPAFITKLVNSGVKGNSRKANIGNAYLHYKSVRAPGSGLFVINFHRHTHLPHPLPAHISVIQAEIAAEKEEHKAKDTRDLLAKTKQDVEAIMKEFVLYRNGKRIGPPAVRGA
uniref:Uncharacterized protein n=1 Tax=Mycena chlorophos TaxID=658473 RepID=A0ABQ0KUC9_MYCCL|nr:predicted protein [Mycena chlorophos]